MANEFDELDFALAELLQHDATTSQAALGEALNLSTAAVNRRIKRLIESGLITSIEAVLDPSKAGFPVTIISNVEVINEQAELLEKFEREMLALPQVQQCYYVTGQADFVVTMVVKDMAEYSALSRKCFTENNNVKKFSTLVVMKTAKNSRALPLNQPQK